MVVLESVRSMGGSAFSIIALELRAIELRAIPEKLFHLLSFLTE